MDLEGLQRLATAEKWGELLDACLVGSVAVGPQRRERDLLVAAALFHCGRFDDCAQTLADVSDIDWNVRLNAAAAQLTSARATKNSRALRSLATTLNKLAREQEDDSAKREAAVFNLCLAYSSLGDRELASSALEGWAKSLVLSAASSSKRARIEDQAEAVVMSAPLRLASALSHFRCGSDSFRSLLAACYVVNGQADAAVVLFDSCEQRIEFAEFRALAGGVSSSLAELPPLASARRLLAMGELDKCEALLRNVDSFEAHEVLGCARLQAGRLVDAVASLKRSLVLSSAMGLNQPHVLYNLLFAITRCGKPVDEQLQVLAVLIKSLRNGGKSADLVNMLLRQGQLLSGAKRHEEAAAAFDEAVSLDTLSAQNVLEQHTACLMQSARYEDAFAFLAHVEHSNVHLFNRRLECLILLNRLDDLLHHAEQWIAKLADADASLMCNAALLFLAHGHVAKATLLMKRAREMDPSSLHVAYNQTLLFVHQKRFDDALRWLAFRNLLPSHGTANLEEVRQARQMRLTQHQQLPPPQRRGVLNMHEASEVDALRLDIAILALAREHGQAHSELLNVLNLF